MPKGSTRRLFKNKENVIVSTGGRRSNLDLREGIITDYKLKVSEFSGPKQGYYLVYFPEDQKSRWIASGFLTSLDLPEERSIRKMYSRGSYSKDPTISWYESARRNEETTRGLYGDFSTDWQDYFILGDKYPQIADELVQYGVSRESQLDLLKAHSRGQDISSSIDKASKESAKRARYYNFQYGGQTNTKLREMGLNQSQISSLKEELEKDD